MPYTIEFYEAPDGTEPVRNWARDLSSFKRRALGVALEVILASLGQDVCGGEWGKNLGQGLFEFRIRRNAQETLSVTGQLQQEATDSYSNESEKVLLRVFCHAHGNKIILLLAGYDKAKDPSDKRQQTEISTARKRLREYRSRKIT